MIMSLIAVTYFKVQSFIFMEISKQSTRNLTGDEYKTEKVRTDRLPNIITTATGSFLAQPVSHRSLTLTK
jgi:hypothetical protein